MHYSNWLKWIALVPKQKFKNYFLILAKSDYKGKTIQNFCRASERSWNIELSTFEAQGH